MNCLKLPRISKSAFAWPWVIGPLRLRADNTPCRRVSCNKLSRRHSFTFVFWINNDQCESCYIGHFGLYSSKLEPT